MKACAWLVAVGLVALTACSETTWVQPGVTDQQMSADLDECAQIARQEAKRNRWFTRSYTASRRRSYRSGYGSYGRGRPTLSELEFRYRFDCMVDRGYQLAPPDEQPNEQPD